MPDVGANAAPGIGNVRAQAMRLFLLPMSCRHFTTGPFGSAWAADTAAHADECRLREQRNGAAPSAGTTSSTNHQRSSRQSR